MEQLRSQEARLAELFVEVLDYVGRVQLGLERGDWFYLYEKAAALGRVADRLVGELTGADGEQFEAPNVRPAAVMAVTRRWAQRYSVGRALYPSARG